MQMTSQSSACAQKPTKTMVQKEMRSCKTYGNYQAMGQNRLGTLFGVALFQPLEVLELFWAFTGVLNVSERIIIPEDWAGLF